MSKYLRLAAAAALAAFGVVGTASAAPKKPPKPPPPPPDKVDVTVVEVAGTHAYLKPGAKAGIRRGSHVFLGNREFIVGNSTTHYAIIDLGDDPPREGEVGTATMVEEAAVEATKLPAPRPDSAFEGQWKPEEPPASGKAVRFVPLGDSESRPKNDVRFTLLAGGTFPIGDRGGTFANAELNARVHAEPFAMPLALILDASIQGWFGPGVDNREGSSARPLIRAREILLSYGTNDGVSGQLGRMRYAAATLDTLDGVRVRTTVGDSGLSLAAFGGLLPDPNNGDPSTAAQRFGVEAGYSDPTSSVHPEAAIVANGSVFHGNLDERRIGGVFGLFPDHARLGAHFEVGNYPAGNPFKAAAVELNNAGVDGALIFGNLQIGARLDMRKPDRSLWLASYLPHDFFCLLQVNPAANTVPVCDGRTETRVEGSLDATYTHENIVVAAGATTARDIEIGGLPSMYGGYVNGRVLKIAGMFRADVGAAYTQSTYLNMLSATAGPGVALFDDALDLGAYYRFASVSYFAGGDPRLENGVGLTGMYVPSRQLAFTLQAEAIKGSDIDALVTLLTAMYRPAL